MTDTAIGLPALERRIAKDLEILAYPNKPWVRPVPHRSGRQVYDAVIVGAGQGGLGTAFGLLREHVRNILVIDARDDGEEGPWMTYARMPTLRTVKELIGPDNDQAGVTFRSWYEAQHGAAGWDALVRVPREAWMDYLRWFRRVLCVPVRNGTRVVDIAPDDGLIRVEVACAGGGDVLLARKVVMQTGLEGSGEPAMPTGLWEHLPRHLWAHTSDRDIDWARLKGGRVGVLGAGASAFDNAIVAAEHGAASVDVFARREELPRVNFMRGIEFTGFFRHFGDLDDLDRWRFMRRVYSLQVPPPPDTYARAIAAPGLRFHPGCPWRATRPSGKAVMVETALGSFEFDRIVFGTGFSQDVSLRPELATILGVAARWRDRFVPPAGEDDPVLARQPYLGRSYEFTEREPGAAPWLRHVRFCSSGSWVSMGPTMAGLNGMKFGLGRLVAGLCRDLFREDAAWHYESYLAYDTPELTAAMPSRSGGGG